VKKQGDDAIIEARMTESEARFGRRLTDEQREQVRTRHARTLALAQALRTVPLTNADEPEYVFVPFRKEG